MARSKGVTISVRIPVDWDKMTQRKQQRIRQITGRDTRIIRAILGIIEQHEESIVFGKNRLRIDEGKLDRLTMTALQVRSGHQQRIQVPHDLKQRFPRISVNELSECRSTAIALYESYLRLRSDKRYRPSKPCAKFSSGRIPRWIFSQRFSMIETPQQHIHWWLNLRDTLDSVPAQKRIHDRIMIPLKMSPFHMQQMARGEVKALQIYTDPSGKWWTSFAVRLSVSPPQNSLLPPAVVGIDLGINKAACAAVLTSRKVSETRFFVQQDKHDSILGLEMKVSALQRELHLRQNRGLQNDYVAELLRKMKNKRENVAKEHDRVLVRQIVDFVLELSEKYTPYIAIGRLNHIRLSAQRGNGMGPEFRGLVHKWAFARITQSLKHQLLQLGFRVDGRDAQFRAVSEAWTSIICWKCGKKGIRPRQNLFVCPTCGNKCNADRNGAINIAARLLTLTKSLHSVRGLGKWADAVLRISNRSQPKAQGRSSSQGKSLLSHKEFPSDSGESAAVHYVQSDLTSFSDESSKRDNDPAVEKAMVTLTAVEVDGSTIKQEKETQTTGGIVSR